MSSIIPAEKINSHIHIVRNEKIMLDRDIARLYQVEVKALVQAVKRNRDRFPSDFMFQLTFEEFNSLRSQIVTSNNGRGGRRYMPYAFTEQGVAMLSSVLHSRRAAHVNIAIMRTFIKLRQFAMSHRELSQKLAELERIVGNHDGHIQAIFHAIRRLIRASAARKSKRRIGFQR